MRRSSSKKDRKVLEVTDAEDLMKKKLGVKVKTEFVMVSVCVCMRMYVCVTVCDCVCMFVCVSVSAPLRGWW